ncbi:hypothetical protein [Thiomicrospira sp. ALE5]|uniref:hypothetical protein n=1 Tax=Thiomicrospira sp. ALE5 TaxID=748650 RepID=UPI0008E0D1C6|nr:hypothetical protein [Thiomicrospira sp. ALE5]SFR53497.1 hypothetical protein SAMN03092900_0870 [Thiomicrospira sp. ALE5]
MAEKNETTNDDIDDIDALLDELSEGELDEDLADFTDSLQESDDSTAAEPEPEPDLEEIPDEPKQASVTEAEDDLLEINDDSLEEESSGILSDPVAMAPAAAATTAPAAAAVAAEPKRNTDKKVNESSNTSNNDAHEKHTEVARMETSSNQPVTVALTKDQNTELKKIRMMGLATAGLAVFFSLGAFIMATLAWNASGTGHLDQSLQLQHETSEQQQLLLQNLSQQISNLEQKLDVSRLLIDDVLAAQQDANQLSARQRQHESEVAPPQQAPAAAAAQVNTQALERRIVQLQRTANTIQSRVTQVDEKVAKLDQRQVATAQAVREFERAWLEQLLAQQAKEAEEEAKPSAPVAPDAYRYIAPSNQFSYP